MSKETIEVRGVLFDMDGVLVSSIGSAERCWRQWAASYGVPHADKVTFPHGTRAIDIMALLAPEVDRVEGLRRIEDLEIADTGDLRVLPGVEALLESLPKQQWTIVTSATRRLLVGRLAAAGLTAPDQIITGEMVTRGKPDPEPYRKGAEFLGQAPATCLVVEDAPTGVRAGRGAGCRVLGVEGTHDAGDLFAAGADFVVQTLEDVRVTRAGDVLKIEVKELPRPEMG